MALNDRELLARTLQAEAGNQGFGGMIAAGSVIMNRLGSNGSLRNVILKPGQFSAWNSVTGYAGGEQGQNMDFTPSAEAYKAADALLSGKYQDPTGGATHYYNPSISTPSWGQEAGGQWTKIGAHLFGTPSGEKRTTTPRVNAGEVSPMDGQQPMQQQMPQQGPQGLMGFLRDPRTRQVLSAFSRSGVGQRLGQIAAQDVQRQEQQQTANRTAQWLRTQPNGESYAEAIEAGMGADQVYRQYISDRQDTQSPNVQSSQMLPDMSGSVLTMRDGSIVVKTSGGETLTGQAAQDFVSKSQATYTQQQQDIYGARRTGTLTADVELGGQAEQVKAEGKNKVAWIDDIRSKRDNIMSTIGNYDMALQALDAGASTGRVAALLPTVTAQTQLLETAKKQLGLDVIGSVTFGALSEGELALAMDTGLPSSNLGPEELRKWIMDRKAAKEKAAQALFETAAYLAKPDTTYESYYTDFLGVNKPAGGAMSDNPLGL